MRQKRKAPGVDAKLLIKDAAKLLPQPSRRLFLRGAASLGCLAMLTGCDIIDGPTAENALRVVSRFNDRVQALLFSKTTLAPEFPESAITRRLPSSTVCRKCRRSPGSFAWKAGAPSVRGRAYGCPISSS